MSRHWKRRPIHTGGLVTSTRIRVPRAQRPDDPARQLQPLDVALQAPLHDDLAVAARAALAGDDDARALERLVQRELREPPAGHGERAGGRGLARLVVAGEAVLVDAVVADLRPPRMDRVVQRLAVARVRRAVVVVVGIAQARREREVALQERVRPLDVAADLDPDGLALGHARLGGAGAARRRPRRCRPAGWRRRPPSGPSGTAPRPRSGPSTSARPCCRTGSCRSC